MVIFPFVYATNSLWDVCREDPRERLHGIIPPIGCFLACPGALWLVATGRSASWHLRLASTYAVLNWLSQTVVWQSHVWNCALLTSLNNGTQSEILLRVFTSFAVVIYAGTVVCGARLAIVRIKALETTCLVNFFTRQLEWVFWTFICLLPVLIVNTIMDGVSGNIVGIILVPVLVALAFLGAFILMRAQCRAMRLALVAHRQAPGGRTSQAWSIYLALRRELLCTVLMMISSGAAVILYADIAHFVQLLPDGVTDSPSLTIFVRVLNIVDALCNQWFAVHLSGATSGAMQGSAARAMAAKGRRARWLHAEGQWLGRWKGARAREAELWDEKVYDLAGRGISLEALLHFWRRLPGLMQHFDPVRHTTNDVVRGAIVPFTAEQRASCATVLMGGGHNFPHKMVTHNWSNLFRDLMAAILADALGENEFSMISTLLMTDVDRLEKWVKHAKVAGRTYWVCAFSVNQHTGICGSIPPGAVDTVTGVPPKPCDCGLEKAWNETEPLLSDGRGIPCEMNKFDDMMKFLSATDPAFEQVLAIDSRFGLFSRAWCVAEIATANQSGMMQRLKIHSQEAFSDHAEQMRSLKIQEMEATRIEDKQAILDSIKDLEEFNSSLQKLLFEDLFPAWNSLDAEERMANAGSIIRWLPVWATTTDVDAAADIVVEQESLFEI